MIEQGLVTNVISRVPGSELVVSTLTTDTVLQVDSVYDFNSVEDGGGRVVLNEDGTERVYIGSDPDLDTITLASPVGVVYEEGIKVHVFPAGEAKYAMVDLFDDDEGVEALIIDPARAAQFETGIRDESDQESVMVDDSSGRWILVAADEEPPRFASEYVDVSDGFPPDASPATTLKPLYATMVARWPVQENADLVGYNVWMSAPDVPAAQIGSIYGTSLQIISEPSGVALRKNIIYSVWVHAFDEDGLAPSGGVAGTAELVALTREELEQQVIDEIEAATATSAAAQTSANTANAAAAAAQVDADAAAATALNAANAASAAQTDADSAQTTANNASAAAGNAQTTANNAASAASAAQTDADSAALAAADAAGLAGSKGKVIIQSAAPAVADRLAQNLWIDTTGGANTPKRWDGVAWVVVTDKAATDAADAAVDAATAASTAQTTANNAASAASAAQTDADSAAAAASTAQSAANAAQSTANSKGKLIVQVSAPTGANAVPENLWIDISGTPAKNQPKRYNTTTSAWEAVTDKVAVDAAAQALAAYNDAATAQARADQAFVVATDAATAAGQAQTTANGKNRVWYLPGQPPAGGHQVNDIWFETDNDNLPYKWDGANWVAQPLGNAAIGNLDAAKITTGYLDVANRIQAGSMGVEKLDVEVIVAGDVYANSGYLGTLLADQIQSGLVDAVLGILGALEIGSNIRIDPVNGIVITLDDGTIRFPANGAPAEITAGVNAKWLTVEDNLVVKGSGSITGSVTLANGITEPKVGPSVSTTHRSRTGSGIPGDGNVYTGLVEHNSTQYVTLFNYFGTGLRKVNKDSTWTWGGDIDTSTWGADFYGHGACKIGTDFYVIGQDNARPSPGSYFGNWYIYRINGTTGAKVSELYLGADNMFGGFKPALVNIADTVGMLWSSGNNDLNLRRYNPTLTGLVGQDRVLSTQSIRYSVMDAHYGPHDANRLWVALEGYGTVYAYAASVPPTQVNDPTWSRNLARDFPRGGNAVIRGLAYDTRAVTGGTEGDASQGDRFNSLSGNNSMYDYGRNIEAESILASHTWYDGNATGGTHETQEGPRTPYTRPARSGLVIESPSLAPDALDQSANTDKANQIRLYASAGALAPRLRSTLATMVRRETYWSAIPTATGDLPPGTNGFLTAGSAPGVLAATDQGFTVDGNSDGSVGTGTFRDSVRDAAKTDTASVGVTVVAPFGGNGITLRRDGGTIYCDIDVTRASSFSSSFVTVGTIPVGWRPAAVFADAGQHHYPQTSQYQFLFNTDGTIQVRMTAASAAGMYAHVAWSAS